MASPLGSPPALPALHPALHPTRHPALGTAPRPASRGSSGAAAPPPHFRVLARRLPFQAARPASQALAALRPSLGPSPPSPHLQKHQLLKNLLRLLTGEQDSPATAVTVRHRNGRSLLPAHTLAPKSGPQTGAVSCVVSRVVSCVGHAARRLRLPPRLRWGGARSHLSLPSPPPQGARPTHPHGPPLCHLTCHLACRPACTPPSPASWLRACTRRGCRGLRRDASGSASPRLPALRALPPPPPLPMASPLPPPAEL